jgi:hypothetical protein
LRSALLIHAFAVGGVLHRVEILRALLQSSIAATHCDPIPAGKVESFFVMTMMEPSLKVSLEIGCLFLYISFGTEL